eukprot:290293-Chlamydomonas_euryale.AAC.2
MQGARWQDDMHCVGMVKARARGRVHQALHRATRCAQATGARSKRTPKPSAKVLAASPLSSKRAAAGMSPQSARAKAARNGGGEEEPGSARKRRQRRLFADDGHTLPASWKGEQRC